MSPQTFYPPGNNYDGIPIRDVSSETFSTIRNGAGNNFSSETHQGSNYIAAALLSSAMAANRYSELWRYIVSFDTSSIPDNAKIKSAQLSLYGYSKSNGIGSPALHITSANPSNPASLSASDFNKLGDVSFGSKSYAEFSTSGYNDFTLNDDGIANISKIGISSFGTRLSWDLAGSFSGGWQPEANSLFMFHINEHAGTSRDPKLTVEYETPKGSFLAFFTP